jgi:hypothetical protein
MMLCAFRYCLGRTTYAVSMCVNILINNWDFLETHDKDLIIKEIREAIKANKIGHSCDKTEWLRIIDHAIGGH